MKTVCRSGGARTAIALLGLAFSLAVQGRTALQNETSPDVVPLVPIPLGSTAYAQVSEAPAAIREFLREAEVADKIEDPLARCLSFPDLPGNEWPRGLAKAVCEYAYIQSITLAKDKELIDRGAFAELDKLFAADLERHFSKTRFSEAIHADYSAIGDSYESGRLTKKWLDNDPGSAFALTARARYYRLMAAKARGSAWAADTPDENMARMQEFADLAVDLYQRALKIEPRLLSAYAGLLDVAGMTSREDLFESTMQAAWKIDPACYSVAGTVMNNLEPRWGGSYEAMLQLSKELQPFLDQRPLLAIVMLEPWNDRADRLMADSRYAEAVAVLAPVVTKGTNVSLLENMAVSMVHGDRASYWQALMYIMEAARFSPESDKNIVNRDRAWLLLHTANRLEWAAKYVKIAIAANPEDGSLHYLAATIFLAAGRLADAEAEYRTAIQKMPSEQSPKYELATVLMREKKPELALEQIKAFTSEYPDYSQGWLAQAAILDALQRPGVNDALQKFLAIATPIDATTSAQIYNVQRQLKAGHVQFPTEW